MSKTYVEAIAFPMTIPTYPESHYEELPMFAENRNHQGTSGNPYPNAIVVKPRQDEKIDVEYTAVRLENEYLQVILIPQLGGKIFAALDKTTGYDFFYRQHVIKPAMIGALGSWISGGVEFNWPFHHRPSTLMATDWSIERGEDGSATVWMSEHDPYDRMKGMVGVTLYPGKAYLETKVRLANRTPLRHSFLWWENAAVAVHPDYRIFFPPDVDHVVHHYRRSAVSYPIAKGDYGGHDYGMEGVDISRHGNTPQSTSFFAAWSKYDFFGGYDEKKHCGVVHIADHHISPGKKMFTWAYNQLSKSWEDMLTDADGPYCELMAGTYTDNQPDFSWLEPYETKSFSQYWYPIGSIGVPTYASLKGAVTIRDGKVCVQVTADTEKASVILRQKGADYTLYTGKMEAGKVYSFDHLMAGPDYEIRILAGGEVLLSYATEPAEEPVERRLIRNYPLPAAVTSAHRAYLTGLHILQYRDPTADAEVYFRRALELDGEHTPSMILLGECLYKRGLFAEAKELLEKALATQNVMNQNPESGKNSYLLGLTLDALGETDKAYTAFRKAAWDSAYVSPALTKAAAIRMRSGEYDTAENLLKQALDKEADNPLAGVYLAFCSARMHRYADFRRQIEGILARDPLNQLARYALVTCGMLEEGEFFGSLDSSPSQTVLDLLFDLRDAGLDAEAEALLDGTFACLNDLSAMVYYAAGKSAPHHRLNRTFPWRLAELDVLEKAVKRDPEDSFARYLLGCQLYAYRQYDRAQEIWESCPDLYEAWRNRACCLWRKGQRKEAIALLGTAFDMVKALGDPDLCEEIIYERAYLMNRSGADGEATVSFIEDAGTVLDELRDDIAMELCNAYNRAKRYGDTLQLLMEHRFRPCEGGEAAIVNQYITAKTGLAGLAKDAGQYEEALRLYEEAGVIPDAIGAALWDDQPLMHAKFNTAYCLDKLGRREDAVPLWETVAARAGAPLLKARAMLELGRKEEAKKLLEGRIAGWKREMELQDSGYFRAQPFFISYMEDAGREREAVFSGQIREAERILTEAGL